GLTIQQAVVAFVIDREGNVTDKNIEKSSGSQEFDMAALRAIQNSHFPPLPVGYNEPTLRVHMGFIHEPD
ncbi:MAG: energy transducer TonB, partial [Nitrospinae bacterium]|nr:energy transducer TonB [Nitrospinota bacterium]